MNSLASRRSDCFLPESEPLPGGGHRPTLRNERTGLLAYIGASRHAEPAEAKQAARSYALRHSMILAIGR